MPGSTACIRSQGPFRHTSISGSQSFSTTWRLGGSALLTRISIGPKGLLRGPDQGRHLIGLPHVAVDIADTPPCAAARRPPARPRRPRRRSRPVRPRGGIARRSPPIPRAAPVISATFPASCPATHLPFCAYLVLPSNRSRCPECVEIGREGEREPEQHGQIGDKDRVVDQPMDNRRGHDGGARDLHGARWPCPQPL